MSKPNTDKSRQQTAIVHQQQTVISSGPIPPASSLVEYRAVRDDLPDLIITEWIKEADTRRDLARREFDLTERNIALAEKMSKDINRLEYARLIVATLFSGGVLWLAWWLASNNHIETAIIIAALPVLAAIASAGIKALLTKR